MFKKVTSKTMGGNGAGAIVEAYPDKLQNASVFCSTMCGLANMGICTRLDEKGKAIVIVTPMLTQIPEDIIRLYDQSACFEVTT